MKLIVWLCAVLSLGAGPAALQAQHYTYPQIVDRMTDMQDLAVLPPVGERTALASSYDRLSVYDAATDKYLHWEANADGSGVVGKEGDNFILADIKGPGVINRIWSATPGIGHVKIYLDGATTPTVDLPFTDYFSGKVEPFNRPNMVYGLMPAAPGFDNYTPITFAKSCRIIGEKGWGNYYQFTYTQFAPHTVVPTFSMKLSKADAAALDRANKILGDSGENPAGNARGTTKTIAVTAEAGKQTPVATLTGAGAITALKVKITLPKDPSAQRIFLRQLTVSIAWDGEDSPSVWSPLGDFFAYVGGAIPFKSLPVGYIDDGTFYSYWYMPFGKKAQIVVGNDGPQSVPMTWEVTRAPLTRPIASMARFHAKWHMDAYLPNRADRALDWPLVKTWGRGRFVGTHLHGWNPVGGWWGEGDDKFFVDGEKYPSSFGTGSEDYFGYAWSSSNLFSKPYHDQILNEKNQGHFDDNRFHISDSVPFQTSFEGDIEKMFPNHWETAYAAVAYWYLDVKGTDAYGPEPVGDRVGYWAKSGIYREPNAIEGESMRTMNAPLVRPGGQLMISSGTGWSGWRQMIWHSRLGDVLELALPVTTAGKYHVVLRYTKAPDCGIVQASVDGVAAGKPMDLYAPGVVPDAPVDLGVYDLTAGDHRLKLEVTGKNAAATWSYVGLDYVKLVPDTPKAH
jgi:hypothetical protein